MRPMSLRELQFLAGGGEMGARLRDADWSGTPLGPADSWPPALRTLVALMLASNQPMYVVWGPTRSFLYNDHYAPFLGAKHPWALGRDLLLEVWPEIRTELEPLVESARAGDPVQVPRMQLILHRNGYPEETHFSFFFAPVRDESGHVAGMFGACNDVTAQVQAERQLATSDARHRDVLANMDEAFALMDRDYRLLEVNGEAVRLMRHSRAEIIGQSHWELFPGTFDTDLGRMYRQVVAEDRPASLEYPYSTPECQDAWLEVRAFPAEEGVAVLFRDITARRQAVAEAALAAERVQLALDAGAIVGTWVWTIPDNRMIADERFAHRFGLDPRQCRDGLTLETAFESIHPDDRAHVQDAIAEVMGRGGPYRCEYRVRQYDGAYAWVEANGRVELDTDGKPVRFPGVLLDHGERRRAENERDQATALLRTFIEAVPGVAYAKDRDGRLIIGNRGVSELLGLPQEAYLGRTDREVLADAAQAEAVMSTDRRIMDSGVAEQVEEEIHLADGTPAWWLSTKAPMRDAHGKVVGLIGASMDITDRKRIENALRLSEQRIALAMDVAQLGTWTWDRQADAITLDARTVQICGMDPGRDAFTLHEVAARVHPDDWPRVEAALRAALAPTSDGRFTEEFRLVHPGGDVMWVMTRGQATFQDGGDRRSAVSMIGSLFDVTERRRMIETLEQADRRKDEFLAMLAHELRNPLAPIGTAAQLLRLAPGDAARVGQAAEVITRQVGHMTQMVDDLLDVSRVTRGLVQLDREPVELRAIMAAAIEQAEPLLQARHHRLLTESPGGEAVVLGDRHRLVQVVSNLLHNAAKYTPQGGKITLSIVASDEEVEIRVCDNGIGMDDRLVPRVFDLFTQAERTPDRSQGGLGIGLALVRSLVHMHGGRVFAHSAGTGRGSTFTVVLPRAASGDMPAPQPQQPQPRLQPRTVLVVDDNRDAAETLADVLRVLGHEVIVAGNGHEALEIADSREDWDAFILDIGMPDMTGHELAVCLRERLGARPARFIALTGYGQAHDRALTRDAGFDHHLVKPANVADIQSLLARSMSYA
jgi:PAS domain S-box-containing protein